MVGIKKTGPWAVTVTLLSSYKFDLNLIIRRVVIVIALWATVYLVDEKLGSPKGRIFDLMLLTVVAGSIGTVFCRLLRLPVLFGVLVIGIFLKNYPTRPINGILSFDSSTIRGICLAIIMLRGGLSLNVRSLKNTSWNAILLAIIPQFVEATIWMGMSAALMGWPTNWGYILGYTIAGISPSVVIPSMIQLKEQGYGANRGVPELVLTSATLDCCLAIIGFGMSLGMTVTGGNMTWKIIRGFLEIIVATAAGAVFGLILIYVFLFRQQKRFKYNILLVLTFSWVLLFGGRKLDSIGGANLACMIMGCTIKTFLVEEETLGYITTKLTVIWDHAALIIFFALTGAGVDFANIKSSSISKGLLMLLIGLVGRCFVVLVCTTGTGLLVKEKIFCAIAWIPKAAVQSAVCTLALEAVKKLAAENPKENYSSLIERGQDVLTYGVLSIVVCAPIGAVLITNFGSRLLTQEIKEESNLPPEIANILDDNEVRTSHDRHHGPFDEFSFEISRHAPPNSFIDYGVPQYENPVSIIPLKNRTFDMRYMKQLEEDTEDSARFARSASL